MTDADKPRFLHAIARLAVALREPAPDAAQMHVYFNALKDVEIEFILAAAEALMRGALWFPKVAEWRQRAVKIERDRLEAQRASLRKLPAPLCPRCDDTGWTLQDNRASRCACVAQRRLELLGRIPSPYPELPDVSG